MPHTDSPAEAIVLLIAHGSRAAQTEVDHAAMCEQVAAASGADVRPAYLEISSPSIPEAIDRAIADGATDVRLVPFFLHLGTHVARDLPGIADDAATRHPDARITVEEHLGSDPALIALLAGRVRSPRPT